jgi:hypothetical protein
MSESWEYMSVIWTYSTKKVPSGTSPGATKQAWRSEYFINRHEKDVETRVQYDFGEDALKVSFLGLANELGAEGWELTTESVLVNAVMTGTHGWTDVGGPIETRWIFKRRA